MLHTAAMTTTLYIDADACPVKDEAVRVAERHGLAIHFVSNAFMRLPEGPLIKRVVVSDGPDAADDWIAERISQERHRRHRRHPAGRPLPGGRRARDRPHRQALHGGRHRPGAGHARLSRHLRETGESKGYNASFSAPDRSRFLQALDEAVQATKRAG